MNRWWYTGLLAVVAAYVVVMHAELLSRDTGFFLTCALVLGATLLRRFTPDRRQPREFRQTYQASGEAVYTALCGVLAELNYRVKAHDACIDEVRFTGGRNVWWGGPDAEGTASVHQNGDGAELVISLHDVPEGHPVWGGRRATLLWGANRAYPEGIALRAKRILDRVQATVVTYAMIDP